MEGYWKPGIRELKIGSPVSENWICRKPGFRESKIKSVGKALAYTPIDYVLMGVEECASRKRGQVVRNNATMKY